MRTTVARNPVVITSDETRLTTKEIISLRTGWRICDAIKDARKAEQFVSFLNSQLEAKGLPKVSGTDRIKELMAAMLPTGYLIEKYDEFGKYVPATDAVFAHVDSGKTFAEANSGMPGYHVYRDRETGEIWRFQLPEFCADYYHRKGTVGFEEYGAQVRLADIRPGEWGYTLLLTTSLDKVASFSVDGKENVLEFAPDAWRLSYIVDAGPGQYNNGNFICYDSGRLAYFSYSGNHLDERLTIADKGHHSPRSNWLGVLKIGFDDDRAEYDIRCKKCISAAHQASWPTHVIIDAEEANRLLAENAQKPQKEKRRPVQLVTDKRKEVQKEEGAWLNDDAKKMLAIIDKHIESAQSAIAKAQDALKELIELKNKITGEQGG